MTGKQSADDSEYRIVLERADISAEQLKDALTRGGIKRGRLTVERVGGDDR
ncbi:hypothetical protein HZS55_09840 [Halosimplex rubrum]|uniref:Uncharacterized protein n=1 Tax=Halosimplex rubrum TaxID=869889 RepID=A0A7D5P9D9_9EURY|nr:hypothetical protein [Halosimplex rubrum]QLH77580.1 hypothetical protein HZS55_09840 [Halosimplex rubrum]